MLDSYGGNRRGTGRGRVPKADPIGAVNLKKSTLERLHRIREHMSGEGKLIPLHEVLARLVEGYEREVMKKD